VTERIPYCRVLAAEPADEHSSDLVLERQIDLCLQATRVHVPDSMGAGRIENDIVTQG
jgi:hypothetical protein